MVSIKLACEAGANSSSEIKIESRFERAIILGENYIKDSREEGWEEWINKLAGTSELLDWLVSDLLNEHLALKEMRANMKTKIVFYDKKKQTVFNYMHKPTPESLDYFRKKNPDVLLFNDIPEPEAFYYWRKI